MPLRMPMRVMGVWVLPMQHVQRRHESKAGGGGEGGRVLVWGGSRVVKEALSLPLHRLAFREVTV
eukprot:39342-Chlamydomonas_euryale.AAC.6